MFVQSLISLYFKLKTVPISIINSYKSTFFYEMKNNKIKSFCHQMKKN